MFNIKRWLVRRVRLKLFSIYLFFTLIIYLFICLNQIEETSLPWYQQQQPQPLQLKRSVDEKQNDELVYFSNDQYMDKKLSTIRLKIEKHLLQMESKLVKNRNEFNNKIALIMYDYVNNINPLYLKLLQSNGYQVYFNNINISDWTILLNLNNKVYQDNQKCSNSNLKYENNLDNLSILFENRALFCAAFSVIYKEINLIELNKFNKVTNLCYVLPDQKIEFIEVAIALGNVDWLIKKSNKNQFTFKLDNDDDLISNQNRNKLINEKVWNIIGTQKSTNKFNHHNLKKLNKLNYDNESIYNLINLNSETKKQDNNLIDNYFKTNTHLDNLIQKNQIKNKFNHQKLDHSLKFAIEIIDSLSGKVFRSNHHSNDILQSINFQNFELQKFNDSIVYVQKSINKKSDAQKNLKLTKKIKNQIQSNQIQSNSNQTDQPILLHLFTQNGKKFMDQFEQYKSLEKDKQLNTIVEKKIDNLFKINNDTISIRQYILIKNLNPLRAYLFNEGLVFFMQNTTTFKSKTGHWLFSHLRNYFDKQYPNNIIYSKMIEVLNKFLLITEFHLISKFKLLEKYQFFEHPIQFNKNDCNLKQFQLIELELILTDKFEFFIVDVNLEPLIFDNQQIPYREFNKQSKKELILFQKNLLSSVWQFIGLIKSTNLNKNKNQSKQNNLKKIKNLKNLNKRHFRRSISLKKVKDLPRKYLDQLQKQSSKVRRKLLFVNEINYKNRLINNWQKNQFRNTLSKLLIDENIGIQGLNCEITHHICLNEIDLNNILLTNIEYTNNGNTKFDQLYPSPTMCNLNNLIQELNNKLLSNFIEPIVHRTADLHSFLCKLETQLNKSNNDELNNESNSILQNDDYQIKNKNQISKNDYFIDNLLKDKELSKDYYPINEISLINEIDETIENLNYHNNLKNEYNQLNCSLKDEDRYLIDKFELEPKQNLSKFNSNFQFKVKVDYETIKLNLIVNAKHCNSKIKLNQLKSSSINVSLNLGIGMNRIVFSVINEFDKFDQKTYQLIVERLSLADMSTYDQNSKEQFICQINQNCNFKIYKDDKCGLSEIKRLNLDDINLSIEQQLNDNEIENKCTGSEQGRWIIICNNCNSLYTCNTSSQIWLPFNCTYQEFNKNDLQKCLKNKNLLFIGDSTLRGIMHYLIEKLNGNHLIEYEKIHNMRIYSNLNGFSFAFAYYPKFWLENMPSLTSTISKLKNLIKLDNLNSIPKRMKETVIIIGGVHWLSTKHINKIYKLIQTYSNTRLILKSLGSGFHQQLYNVHYLPLDEQRKLIDHNQNLISLAKQKNIQILDTFNLTTFMYDRFFSGSCSCHFYRVINNGNNTYHISGLINKMQSEMIANLICN